MRAVLCTAASGLRVETSAEDRCLRSLTVDRVSSMLAVQAVQPIPAFEHLVPAIMEYLSVPPARSAVRANRSTVLIYRAREGGWFW